MSGASAVFSQDGIREQEAGDPWHDRCQVVEAHAYALESIMALYKHRHKISCIKNTCPVLRSIARARLPSFWSSVTLTVGVASAIR